jgi:hypothetical protein
VFEEFSQLNFSDEIDHTIVGCIFKDSDTTDAWHDQPPELRDSNALIEDVDEEPEAVADWTLPLVSLAVAGILGVVKSKNKAAKSKKSSAEGEALEYVEEGMGTWREK